MRSISGPMSWRKFRFSTDTIVRIFRDVEGVLEVGSPEKTHKRRKMSLRIPYSVYIRWHESHRAKKKSVFVDIGDL